MKQLRLAILVCLALVAPLRAQNHYDRLSGIYDQKLNGGEESVNGKWMDLKERIGKSYLQRIHDLYEDAKQNGDLNAAIAIRAEVTRFRDEPFLTDEHVLTAHEKVAALQNKYIGHYHKAARDHAERFVALTDEYCGALGKLISSLVRSDRLNEAKSVKEGMEGLLASAEYVSAKKLVATEPKESPADVAAPKPRPAATGPKPEHVAAVAKVRSKPLIYHSRREVPPVQTRAENLTYLTHAGRSAAGIMSVRVSKQTFFGEKKHSYSGSSSYYLGEVEQLVPRLEIGVGKNPLKGCTLFVDYYGKGSGTRRLRAKTEKIPLGDLAAGETVFVDPVGLSQVKKSWYVTSRGRYRSSTSMMGFFGAFGGYVVTVFDAEGTLCFQKGTMATLSEVARTSPKDEEG